MKRISLPVLIYSGLCLAGTVLAQAPQATPAPGAAAATAQAAVTVIRLKDGRSVNATAVKREGGNVIATQAREGAAPTDGAAPQIGYAVATIARIDFPEPPQIKQATDLLAQGGAENALAQITPVVAEAEQFKDIPGNYWARTALVQLNALVGSQREADAELLATQLLKSPIDPEAILMARVQIAASWSRKGSFQKAMPIFDEALKKSKAPGTLALAWLNKGNTLLAMNNLEPALLAFLHVSIFWPDEKLAAPGAMLGSARVYTKMKDAPRAAQALKDLATLYPSSPEAAIAAKEESQKLENADSTPP